MPMPNTSFTIALYALGAVVTLAVIGAFFFFGQERSVSVVPSTPLSTVSMATSSPLATTTPPVEKKAPATPIITQKPPPVIVPKPPIVIVPPPITTIGTTTLAVGGIPLLQGGVVHGGRPVPIAYLQITNVGHAGARLTGFWITQTGSAPGEAIAGLSTVDDKGGSRGSVESIEGATLFQNGMALVPTDSYFAPGQERLFTIKATVTHQASAYAGMTLMLVVSSVVSTATAQGTFPIMGTTWTIAQ